MTATFRWRGDPAVGHPQTRRHKCLFYASRAQPALHFLGIASPLSRKSHGFARVLSND